MWGMRGLHKRVMSLECDTKSGTKKGNNEGLGKDAGRMGEVCYFISTG